MSGKPSTKPVVPLKTTLALALSLTSLGLEVIVIKLSKISWYLGFQYQLMVIGVLISIQNLCLQAVFQKSLLLLEARFGKSAIQNYDAILRNQILGNNISRAWRVGLLAYAILPIGIGVAYKKFLGGTATVAISNDQFLDASYGLAYPDLGQYASLSNSIFLSMNANSAFLNASRDDQQYPTDTRYPWAYGYNTLVLSQDSAALLDLPEADYIRDIQGKLSKNETWRVYASVDAIVATRNESIATLRNDTGFLNQTLSYAYNGFASQFLFQPNSDLGFGWTSVGSPHVGDAYCLMGPVTQFSAPTLYWISFVNSTSNEGFLNFMQSAQMFSIRRQSCNATWAITESEVQLLEGNCLNISSAVQTPSSRLLHDGQTSPYALDILPVLVNTLGPYSTTRPNSNWMQTSYVVAAANAWWARSAFLNFGTPDQDSISQRYPETKYNPRNQNIWSIRSTLRANWGLCVVVAAIPVATLLTYLPMLLFYSVPIGEGFGLVSILASIDAESLDCVKGAGLSGELESRIKLNISSTPRQEGNEADRNKITCNLYADIKPNKEEKIHRNEIYY